MAKLGNQPEFGFLKSAARSEQISVQIKDNGQLGSLSLSLSPSCSPYQIVLGKFGLVWFRPFFPKPETELFGFSQNF